MIKEVIFNTNPQEKDGLVSLKGGKVGNYILLSRIGWIFGNGGDIKLEIFPLCHPPNTQHGHRQPE